MTDSRNASRDESDATSVRDAVHGAIEALDRVMGVVVTRHAAEEAIRDLKRFERATPPLLPRETAIVSLLKPKTAGLICDRVWMPFAGEDPRLTFAFGWHSPAALRMSALLAVWQLSGLSHATSSTSILPPPANADEKMVLSSTQAIIAAEYSRRSGAAVAPLYASASLRDAEYAPGSYQVLLAIMENVATVDEGALTWEQVLELRADSESRRALRRLVHWLDREMAGKTESFVSDGILSRLEAYEWALRKHGIRTAIGTLERTLSLRSVLGAGTTAFAVGALAGHPILAALSGTGVVVADVALRVASYSVDRMDIVEANRDVAFVHEVRSRLSSPIND